MSRPQKSIDEIDIKILEALQRNGKLSVKELAAELGLTKTPVYERIHRLEKEGIIQGYVAIVDKRQLPKLMVAFCSITLLDQTTVKVDAFSEEVREMPEVLDCFIIGGDFDILLRVVCPDLQSYYAFVTGKIASLPNVANTKSFFVIEESKITTAWPVGDRL